MGRPLLYAELYPKRWQLQLNVRLGNCGPHSFMCREISEKVPDKRSHSLALADKSNEHGSVGGTKRHDGSSHSGGYAGNLLGLFSGGFRLVVVFGGLPSETGSQVASRGTCFGNQALLILWHVDANREKFDGTF